MPKCRSCKKPIITFNQMVPVFVEGEGRTYWCMNCYDIAVTAGSIAITPEGKSWVIRKEWIPGENDKFDPAGIKRY